MSGPLEPDVGNPTVGKRTPKDDFRQIGIRFPHAKHAGFVMKRVAKPEILDRRIPKECVGNSEAEKEGCMGNLSLGSWIAVGALAILLGIGLYASHRRVKWDARMLTKAAICVALAYLLGLIRLFRMPMGGSIKLVSMLPLVLFAYAFGPLEGILIGCVTGLLHLIVDPYVIHPIQLLVDYPMAYAAVALCCLAKKLPIGEKWRLSLACLLGYLGRFAMAVLSGVVFFAEYAGDQGVLAYSMIYNLSYLGPEAALCIVVCLIPGVERLPGLIRRGAMR